MGAQQKNKLDSLRRKAYESTLKQGQKPDFPLDLKLAATLSIYTEGAPRVSRIVDGHILAKPDSMSWEAWKDMPHVALANLRTLDREGKVVFRPEPELQIAPEAVQKFVGTYGGFCEAYRLGASPADYVDSPIDQPIENVARRQDCLRRAWLDMSPIPQPLMPRLDDSEDSFRDKKTWDIHQVEASFDSLVEGLRGMQDDSGFLATFYPERKIPFTVTSTDLWTLIRCLYLLDSGAGKIGYCENPGCPTPYFVKRRRTQKLCELGPCTDWAHRRDALKYWNQTGEGRRRALKSRTFRQRKRNKARSPKRRTSRKPNRLLKNRVE
jgi:hypothetical protein